MDRHRAAWGKFRLPGLLACSVTVALATGTARAAPECASGEIAVAEGCVTAAAATGRIDAIVRAAMETRQLKAVLAGVAVGDAPPALMAWGESMTGVPATPDMHFRNGAVAIAYLGTLLLRLHDQGRIDKDALLSTWLPDLPRADEVTLTMLMNGTSGYPDYVTDETFLRDLYADPFRHWRTEEQIAIAFRRPLVCDPGACWSYAHTNFVILGRVLEKIAGQRSMC